MIRPVHSECRKPIAACDCPHSIRDGRLVMAHVNTFTGGRRGIPLPPKPGDAA